jgi:hypothetical protein
MTGTTAHRTTGLRTRRQNGRSYAGKATGQREKPTSKAFVRGVTRVDRRHACGEERGALGRVVSEDFQERRIGRGKAGSVSTEKVG